MPSPQAVLKRTCIANRGPRPIESVDLPAASARASQPAANPATGPADHDEHAPCDARIAATHADHVDIEVTCSCGQAILLRCDFAHADTPAPQPMPQGPDAVQNVPSPPEAQGPDDVNQPTQ
jgi:hypothetical protein